MPAFTRVVSSSRHSTALGRSAPMVAVGLRRGFGRRDSRRTRRRFGNVAARAARGEDLPRSVPIGERRLVVRDLSRRRSRIGLSGERTGAHRRRRPRPYRVSATRPRSSTSRRTRVLLRRRRHADRRLRPRRARELPGEQARRPFLAAHEMANAGPPRSRRQAERRRVRRRVPAVFGDQIFDGPGRGVRPRAVRAREVSAGRRRGVRAVQQQVRRVPRGPARSSPRRSCAASRCSTIRTKATAPAAIRARAARTARRRCSRTSRTTTSACRAIRRSRRTTIRRTSTSACAARIAPISPTAATCAARSRCRRCATSRSPRPTSTTASFQTLARCAALLRAPRHESGRVVSHRCGHRPGAEVRRSAAAIRRERQHHRSAVQPPPGRPARAR